MATVTITAVNSEFTGERAGVPFAGGKAEVDVEPASTVDRQKVAWFERRPGYEVDGPTGGWNLGADPAPEGPPAKSDNKDAWIAWAVSQGADPDEAAKATKDDLISGYGG